MAKGKATADRREVVLQIPDIGLSKTEIDSLKKSFKSQLVATMGAKKAARPIIIIVRVRIIVVVAEM
jgi:hypothetical protein